jgi:hypothetical protein
MIQLVLSCGKRPSGIGNNRISDGWCGTQAPEYWDGVCSIIYGMNKIKEGSVQKFLNY